METCWMIFLLFQRFEQHFLPDFIFYLSRFFPCLAFTSFIFDRRLFSNELCPCTFWIYVDDGIGVDVDIDIEVDGVKLYLVINK